MATLLRESNSYFALVADITSDGDTGFPFIKVQKAEADRHQMRQHPDNHSPPEEKHTDNNQMSSPESAGSGSKSPLLAPRMSPVPPRSSSGEKQFILYSRDGESCLRSLSTEDLFADGSPPEQEAIGSKISRTKSNAV